MADAIKRISVRIGGMNYQLVSSENDQYTRQIAAKADEMIRRVMQNNPQLSLNMAAVLALVNAQDELARIFQQFHSLDGQRADSEKQQADTRKELMRLREQNWEMKKEILRLNALCRDYESLLQRSPAQDPQKNQRTEVDLSDDSAYEEESAPAANPAAADQLQEEKTAVTQPLTVGAGRLTQANLDDYLRENGWPQPVEEKKYDRQPE